MFSKRWIIGGIAVILLGGSFFLMKDNKIFNFSKGKSTPVDSLEMMEKLTPQIADLSNQLKKTPQNANLYYMRANEYLGFGNLKYALIDYQKAYQMDSTNATFALGLSDCLFEANNADGAIGILTNYLKTDPKNIDILYNLGIDYFLLPKPEYQKAMAAFNEVLKIDIQNADAYFYKAMIYKESNDTAKAISNFQTTVEVDPDYYDAYMQLGNIYAAQKKDLAIKYFDIAISINDTATEAQYAKAKYYQDNGEIVDAITYYKDMITRNPQDVDAIYNLATIYFGIDSIDRAYRFFDLAIKQAPARAMSYYGKGLCAEELKRTDEAISLYNQALNLDPDLKMAEERLLILNEK